MPKDNSAILPRASSLPAWLHAELRSDHAGETGAVWLYLGLLKFSRDPEVIAFAQVHLETERAHLDFFEAWLEKEDKSMLIPLWRLAGGILGAIAAFGGRNMVFVTVSAVENFVMCHYDAQIKALEQHHLHPEISQLLKTFNADEDMHRRDAEDRIDLNEPPASRLWRVLITKGSDLSVKAAKRI